MKTYELSFEVTQRSVYTATVEANSPKHALKKYKELHEINDPDLDFGEEDVMLECDDDLSTLECVGVYVNSEYGGQSLKMFHNPIID